MRGPNWRGLARSKVPVISAVREATAADVAALREQPRLPAKDRVGRIRERHHLIAQAIAAGHTVPEIRELTGLGLSTIAGYKASPAMKELVAHYHDQIIAERQTEAAINYRLIQRRQTLSNRQMVERLEMADEGEIDLIPIRDLMTMSSDSSDRVGPIKAKANLNVDGTFAAKMQEITERSMRARVVNPGPATPPVKVIGPGPIPGLNQPEHPGPVIDHEPARAQFAKRV